MADQPVICPLLSTSKHLSDIMGVNNGAVLCQEEECAWWDAGHNRCITKALLLAFSLYIDTE